MGNEVENTEIETEDAKGKSHSDRPFDGAGSATQDRPFDEAQDRRKLICDRCGFEMIESNCKITCPNCGNRFDCSDLNIYFD